MIKRIFFIILLLSGTIQKSSSESIALTINNKIITQSDIDNMAKIMLFEAGIKVMPETIKNFNYLAKHNFIRNFAKGRIATRYGIEVNDVMLDRHIKKLAEVKGIKIDQYYLPYHKLGIPSETVFEKRRIEVLWNFYINEILLKSLKITNSDIDNYIKTVRGKKLRNISIISIPWGGNKKQAKKNMQNIISQLKSGAYFHDLAKVYSTDVTALNGGKMGWIAKGEQIKKLDLITWAIPVGVVSNIIEVNKNYVIIKVNDEKRETGEDREKLTRQYISKLIREKSTQAIQYEINRLNIEYK